MIPRRTSDADRGSAATILGYVGATIGLTLTILARQTGTPPYDVLWAEDGRNFLADVLHGGVSSVVEPYAGYLHVVPRIAASVIQAAPPELWASGAAVVAASISAALAVFVYHRLDVAGVSLPARVVAAGLVALPPVGPETYANLANVQWTLAATAAVVLLPGPASSPGSTFVTTLAALSGPLGAVVAALGAARAWTRGIRASAAVMAVAAVVQGVVVLRTSLQGTEGTTTSWSWEGLAIAPIYWIGRVWTGISVGERWTPDLWFVVFAFIGLVAVLCVRRPPPASMWAGLGLSLLLLTIPLVIRAPEIAAGIGPGVTLSSGRFAVAPTIVLGVTVLWTLDRRSLAAWIALVILGSFPVTARAQGPSWSSAVEGARSTCEATGGQLVRIEIAPLRPEGVYWQMVVPCDRLE